MTASREVWFFTAATATGGGGVRHTVALMQAMSQLYGDRLVIVGRDELKNIPLPRRVGRYVAVPLRSRAQKLWWFVRGGAYDLLTPFVDRWLAEQAQMPSLVVLDRSWIGRFAARLVRRGVPVVTMHHNVEVDYVGSTLATPVLRPFLLPVIRSNERDALRHSSLNLCMTDRDAARLRTVYGLPAKTVFAPLGSFETFDQQPPVARADGADTASAFNLVITGSLCDYQTVDGIRWFISDIFPLVKKAAPDVRLVLAGRSPSPEVVNLAKTEGIQLGPNPADMDAITGKAHVYLAPTRLGSGLKLRLRDALRLGMPVVSHEVSARGYEGLFPNPLFQTFTTPEQCVAALLRVRARLPLGAAIRQQLQGIYEGHFSFPAGLARLRGILASSLPATALP